MKKMTKSMRKKICEYCFWNCINGLWDAWEYYHSPYVPLEEMEKMADECIKACLAFHGIDKCPPPD